MIVGTTVFKMDGSDYYSPEFPRGGLGVVFPIDVSHVTASPTATFQLQHRNSEDTSFSDVSGASQQFTSADLRNIEGTALKEILRIKLTFDAGDNAGAGVHFLMQAPTWRPYA